MDVFTSAGNIVPLMDESGEPPTFGNISDCAVACALAVCPCADPALLPGLANWLLDAGGTCIVVEGAGLAPALEPGLANGDVCSAALPSRLLCPSALCCILLSLFPASVLVSFLTLYRGEVTHHQLVLYCGLSCCWKTLLPILPINNKHSQNLTL